MMTRHIKTLLVAALLGIAALSSVGCAATRPLSVKESVRVDKPSRDTARPEMDRRRL